MSTLVYLCTNVNQHEHELEGKHNIGNINFDEGSAVTNAHWKQVGMVNIETNNGIVVEHEKQIDTLNDSLLNNDENEDILFESNEDQDIDDDNDNDDGDIEALFQNEGDKANPKTKSSKTKGTVKNSQLPGTNLASDDNMWFT